MESRPLPEGQGAEEEEGLRMDNAKQQFIDFMQQDIAEWERAAKSAEYLVEYVEGAQQKNQMIACAENYRNRVKVLRDLIELVKMQD